MLQVQGATLKTYEWLPEGEPRAVVQVAHGMVEHAGRYERFANHLVEAGFAVVAADHRGHGGSIPDGATPGWFAAEHGWDLVVEDLHALRQATAARFDGVPYFMLGHSMGSMLLRDYLTRYGEGLAGAVVVGTGGWPATGSAGLALAKLLARRKPAEPGTLLNKIAFLGYNKGFEGRTEFDWLSRDHAEVDAYIADPLCGFVPTNQFFVDLFTGLHRISTDASARRIPKDLPLHLVSGEADPVGGRRVVVALAEQYWRLGLADVTVKLWPGARHEVLNETNRDEVTAEIVDWIGYHLR